MIEFMVLAFPRSGTTWAANWLTTDTTLCLHDPLWTRRLEDLDRIESSRMLGVCCTGMWMFGDWVNRHPARKVILHRPFEEVNASLTEIGLPPLAEQYRDSLEKIDGMHIPWTDIFEKPEPIYKYLAQKPFDAERHALLVEMHIQPDFERVVVSHEATKRLRNLIREN